MLVLAAALLVALFFARHWPKDQTVHYVLGDAAPARRRSSTRAGRPGIASNDWVREATFRYDPGRRRAS